MTFQEGFSWHLLREMLGNQEQPPLVTSQGRWVWSDVLFHYRIANSQLFLDNAEAELLTGAGQVAAWATAEIARRL